MTQKLAIATLELCGHYYDSEMIRELIRIILEDTNNHQLCAFICSCHIKDGGDLDDHWNALAEGFLVDNLPEGMDANSVLERIVNGYDARAYSLCQMMEGIKFAMRHDMLHIPKAA